LRDWFVSDFLNEEARMQVPRKVAQYVRMSTERQEYSIECQKVANAAYAAARGYEIVRTYSDEGVSGLGIAKRTGLKSLLADVLEGAADFSVILVYDVSRWGRFQNPDQSAHYEFVCGEAGVSVEYCAEPFTNDGSPMTTLLKSLKRAMAAEYSRELSVKIKRSKKGLRSYGFWLGGTPGYGLRRAVVMADGRVIGVREAGEWKGMQPSARTVLVWGPAHEIATVRRIYRMFTRGHVSISSIARTLNAEGAGAEGGEAWTVHRVRQVLLNEKYVGTFVYSEEVREIGACAVLKPWKEWERVPARHRPMVSLAMFKAVRRRLSERSQRLTDEELLDDLRRLNVKYGYVSQEVIDAEAIRSSHSYRVRFGTLRRALEAIGYEFPPDQLAASERNERRAWDRQQGTWQKTDEQLIAQLKDLLRKHGRLSRAIIDQEPGQIRSDCLRARFGTLLRVYELAGYEPTDVRQKRWIRSPGAPQNLFRP
jgi:DNA invertase Pin-like site-specific DNA recombinase